MPTELFRIALSIVNGRDLGWLGWDSNHWATTVTDPDQALALSRYVWTDGKTYYCVGSDPKGAWWLSVSNDNRVGFYGWSDATSWSWNGKGDLISNYTGGVLGFKGDNPSDLTATKSLVQGKWTHIFATETSSYAGPIRHLFVLMLENRSFDHMLGFSGITGKDAVSQQTRPINGLRGNESNGYGGRTFPVKKPADWKMTEDPGHEFGNVLKQLCGEGPNYSPGGAYPPINNTGFAADYSGVKGVTDPGEVMKCYDPGQIPALVTLAREFVVCDNWFASMPGPTWPNRYFAFAASSGGLDDSPTPWQLSQWSTANGFQFENGTLFDANALDWRIYVGNKLGSNCASVAGISHFSDLWAFSRFASDLQQGQAAQFTFIEPDYGNFTGDYSGGNSQHPIDDVRSGDHLIADVYNAIRNSPIWERSMLIITWDEHGGFYDHVPPPAATPPGDKQKMSGVNSHGFTFNRYGVRVPAVIVSPLVAKGVIDGRLYDHASIPATAEALFCLGPLTARDKAANSLHTLVTLKSARQDCPKSVPYARAADLDGAFPEAREMILTSAQQESRRQQPIDSMGNLPGFVYSAMCLQIELSPRDGNEAIRARVASLRTVGDAGDYIEEVGRTLSQQAVAARAQT